MCRCLLVLFLFVPTCLLADEGLAWRDYDLIQQETNQHVGFEEPKFPGFKFRVDALLTYPGIAFGERFSGQGLGSGAVDSPLRDFDILNGTPVAPLVVQPGAPGKNLSLHKSTALSGTGLYGESWVGFPAPASGGEGAIAVYFEQPQSAFGFGVHAAQGPVRYDLGTILIRCYNRQAMLLGELHFDGLIWDTYQQIGVARAQNQRDIQGCTIENTDPKGVIFDDFIFSFGTSYMS